MHTPMYVSVMKYWFYNTTITDSEGRRTTKSSHNNNVHYFVLIIRNRAKYDITSTRTLKFSHLGKIHNKIYNTFGSWQLSKANQIKSFKSLV